VALAHPLESRREPERLRQLAGRAGPVILAGEQVLPVAGPLQSLLPDGGLRRGSTVSVMGSLSLALRLVAAASMAGSWTAAVGAPDLGVVAAAEADVVLGRLALVPRPGEQWATVTAALLDALDVVLVRPSHRVRQADARKLVARARERGSVLVPLGPWEGADLRLEVASARWHGVGQGDGHLQGCRMEVVATGRRAAARERRAVLWL
jgi:membrane protein implicated in regulation of membrane protease activity